MAAITIRNLDDVVKSRLRVRAAQRGRSMEEEARDILRAALAEQKIAPRNLAKTIRSRFAAVSGDGVELPIQQREPVRDPPDLG